MDYLYLKFLSIIKAGIGVLTMFFVDLFNALARTITSGAARAHNRAEAAATAKVDKAKQAAIIAAAQAGDQERVREIVREARRNKVMLTMRYARTLAGRVAMPDQNEEED